MPMADSTRPQLGSSPWMAHLRRLLRATARPTSTASSSRAAPTTSIAMSLLAPSASPISCRPRSAQTAVTASANSAAVRDDAGGAGGQQQHGVVGGHAAVGVDPVEGDARWRRAAPRRASSAVEVGVGGEDDEHGGQAGGEHARALGHAADGVAALAAAKAVLATVSVVWMATAASSPPSLGELGGGASDARQQLVHRQPLADQAGGADRDLAGRVRRAPRRPSRRWRGCPGSPAGPVQALAPPELRTTARTRPPLRTCSDQSTGAAFTRLEVKTPAAARRGPVVDDEGQVAGRRSSLIPAAMPAAAERRLARCACTLTVAHSGSMEEGRALRAGRGRCSCSGRRRPRCPW